MTDGEALLVENILPVGVDAPEKVVAGWNPYRTMFDIVWSGRRHVIMGASQIDKYGNQNFAFIGDHAQPTHAAARHARRARQHDQRQTSYWIPSHSTRVFVPAVDVVSGVGYDRAAELGPTPAASTSIVRVVTNLCVLDFDTPDHRMRLRSVHPGVTVDDVVAATGFELAIAGDVPENAAADRRRAALDPRGHRPDRAGREGSARTRDASRTRDLRSRSASTCRSCRPAWAGSPGARLVSATANAGALGILASATMTLRPARGGDPRGARRAPTGRSA